MPVEIRELVIKATISNESDSNGGGISGNTGGNESAPGEELIKVCVEKVLEILKEKNER